MTVASASEPPERRWATPAALSEQHHNVGNSAHNLAQLPSALTSSKGKQSSSVIDPKRIAARFDATYSAFQQQLAELRNPNWALNTQDAAKHLQQATDSTAHARSADRHAETGTSKPASAPPGGRQVGKGRHREAVEAKLQVLRSDPHAREQLQERARAAEQVCRVWQSSLSTVTAVQA